MHLAIQAAMQIAGDGQMPSNPKLVNAAHEFEAQLMKELMKPLTSGSAPGDDGGDADGDSGSNGALGEFASEALAKALSEQGGFGIANHILGQLAQREASERSHADSKTESTHGIGKKRAKSALSPLS
jgi:Rod binding domain-containing protein